MNKAIIGVFADNVAASRAINDLKAYGFGGESISQVLREDLRYGERLKEPQLMPGMEILKGIVSGAIVGAILGGLAYYLFGLSFTLPSLGLTNPLYAVIIAMAIVGAIAGLIEGLLAMGPLARASRALSLRRRGDSIVTVHTDETHASRAADILHAAGALDVRRGASSVADEFRTGESVRPETYATTPMVQREPVEAPEGSRETMETPAGDGGAIG